MERKKERKKEKRKEQGAAGAFSGSKTDKKKSDIKKKPYDFFKLPHAWNQLSTTMNDLYLDQRRAYSFPIHSFIQRPKPKAYYILTNLT